MMFTPLHYLALSTLLSVVILIVAAKANNDHQCENGILCPFPKACCQGQCCVLYDSNEIQLPPKSPHTLYSYHHLSFWNVWYFWCIVIFIIISCFGGCGYWRRRHMQFGSPRFRRQHCSNDNQVREDTLGDSDHETSHPPLRFLPMQTCLNPPPYSEVASKPDMYPLVQGGHDFKNDSVAFVYANTHFVHSYMPYNSGAMYLSSPAESNSSLFQSTTTSNYMYPPPYSDGNCVHPSVSTPGSIMSACTPTEPCILTNPFLSSTSPPMATTPTSQQILSEVTTPADSIASPTSFAPIGFRFYSGNSNLLEDPRVSTQECDLLANLVADIQNMTNRMMRSPALVDGTAITRRSSGTNSVSSPVSPSEISSSGNDSSGQPPRKRPRPVPTEPLTTSGMSLASRDTSMDCGLSLSRSVSSYSHDLRRAEIDSQESELEMDRWTASDICANALNDAVSVPSMSNGSGRSSGAADYASLCQPLARGFSNPSVVSEAANTSPHEHFDVQTNVVAQFSFNTISQQ